ncbi:MAG: hypothetical protein KA224_05575 [Steroidobacteraceae bacterium]|nr:hypothetical protein [Steroidobacteraceae bacterium]
MSVSRSRRIAIVTDAWLPQTNGVVTTLRRTIECLVALGHSVLPVTPEGLRTLPCPTYLEIRLSLFARRAVARAFERFQPDSVHIATEAPLRWFHGAAGRTMVNTPRVRDEPAGHGFRNLVLWGRGVDTELFVPGPKDFLDLPRPVMAYAGRVAVEKSVEGFLALELPGTKLVIGDGTTLADLRARYPQAVFVGYRHGDDLARHLAAAAYPVTGPRGCRRGRRHRRAVAPMR